VAGTLFGGEKPRLVGIDGVPVEAEVAAHMLYVRNEDKPGFIGRLGTALGDAGVNIATFHLGRTAPGENAVALVAVDQGIDEGLKAKIEGLPGVVQVKTLRF
ncbi:MAG: ACT domain-containing protein, partial [Rhodospirillales bacterium]